MFEASASQAATDADELVESGLSENPKSLHAGLKKLAEAADKPARKKKRSKDNEVRHLLLVAQ